MPEPVSAASAMLVGVAAGVALGVIEAEPRLGMLSGVFCGAVLFLLRTREPSRLKKAIYFGISLVGGYAITPAVRAAAAWLPEWFAAFISAASVVVVAMIVLDWSEVAIPQILNRLVDMILGRQS
ncbi:hypothetical protein FAZ95_13735 [Trinickia violacea]|uniref:Phage holin n=1 Tax=Trinickia violacea TaxID=2571746 RepID=A0A4P8ISY9_9BURK|nr:putative holin [Trinickia violacea]QCP50144.1 hypothetical protein FAZ95_13735 [Trinickia violacea]